jgi:hypothetical protein
MERKKKKSVRASSLLFTRVGLIKVDAKYETLFIISIGINAAIYSPPPSERSTVYTFKFGATGNGAGTAAAETYIGPITNNIPVG